MLFLKVGAQDNWDLERCITTAIENNLDVQRSSLQVGLAEQNLTGSKGAYLPSANLFLNSNMNFGRTVDPFTNTFATDKVRSDAYGINANWQIFNGLQRYNRYKQSQLGVMSAKYDADKMVNDISLAVTRSYLEILFNKEILSVAREQVDVTKKQEIRTRKMVSAGSLPEGDLLDIQAQLAQEELNEVTAQNNLDISRLKLLIVMRMDTLEDFLIQVPDIEVDKLSALGSTPSFVYMKAIEILPEVKSAQMQYMSSERTVSAEKGRISPSLSVSGSVGSGYSGKNPNDFGNQVSDNFNQTLGVSLSFPILNSLSTHTAISRAKVNQELAENQMEQVKYQINETVKRAFYDAQAAKKKYTANEKSVSATKQSFEYANKRYELGMMNALEYSQSKNNMMRAESNLLQAKYDYVFKSKILEFYMGKPLSLK